MRESENETEASTTFYLYDREDRIADYDQSGNLLIAYTHGPGIDEPVAMTLNNSTYFYIPDIQGSIRAIISADNGSLAAYYTYDVWGNLVSYGGPMAEKNDYLYTGREYDWQTGIYYYRARYYNPELGRFISQDPAGMVDGPNMYVYVKNEPVNGVDALGENFWSDIFDKLFPISVLLSEYLSNIYSNCKNICGDYYSNCFTECVRYYYAHGIGSGGGGHFHVENGRVVGVFPMGGSVIMIGGNEWQRRMRMAL